MAPSSPAKRAGEEIRERSRQIWIGPACAGRVGGTVAGSYLQRIMAKRPDPATSGRPLPPAALRALAEAAARRAPAPAAPPERGGPAGPDPTRYGDWERKGRAVDF